MLEEALFQETFGHFLGHSSAFSGFDSVVRPQEARVESVISDRP